MTKLVMTLMCSGALIGCSHQHEGASAEQGHRSHGAGCGGCMMVPHLSSGGDHAADGVSPAAEREGRPAVPVPNSEQVTTVYTCPMHPKIVSDRPGTCPQCGMKLVVKK